MTLKTSLQQIEIEQSFLGKLLLDPNLIDSVAHLPIEVFTTVAHRIVWKGMLECHTSGKIPDLLTLALHLRQNGKLNEIGGQVFLGQLFSREVYSGGTEQFAKLLVEQHAERQLKTRLSSLLQSGQIDDKAISEIETSVETFKKVIGKVDRDELLKLELQALLKETDPIKRVRKRSEICSNYSISSKNVEILLASLDSANRTTKAKRYTAAEFMQLEPEGLTWLIPGLLPSKGLTVLGGAPGIGKTTLAYDAAAAVLFGEEFLGENPSGRGKVLFVAADELPCFVQDKLLNRGVFGSKDWEILLDWDVSQMGALEEAIADIRPSLVVIDSFTAIHKDMTFDENSALSRRSVVELEALLNRYSASGLLIHHTTKSKDATGVGKLRGSSAIAAAASVVWLLEGEKQSEIRTFTTPKIRGAAAQNLRLSLDSSNGQWSIVGGNEEEAGNKTIGDRIVEFMMNVPGVKFAAEEISNAIGYGKQSVYKALDRLVQRGIAIKRPSSSDARCKVFGLSLNFTPPTPENEVSNNSAEILDTTPDEVEGGVDREVLINNVTILSDPDIDADVLEYVMMGWTKEFKEAVWQMLGEEVRVRLDAMLVKSWLFKSDR